MRKSKQNRWLLRHWLGTNCIRAPKKLICNSSCLSQATQHSSVNSCRVISDGVFPTKKQPWHGRWLSRLHSTRRGNRRC
ncbi:unnamed protein product [Larinioides sclopetarius]|uniref:Uncharacterized protein n=1 Tax=Larinioides sclopetarius TaxID=280406 RepID=A0AAV2BMQ3_9ARAC